MLEVVSQVQNMLARPFREAVDIEDTVLLLALLLIVAGGWSMVIDRVEL